MKKFLALAGLVAIGFAAFAAEVTVDEQVQVRAAKDSFKDGAYLNRLRSNTTVNIKGEHYDFMYNGRVNAHENNYAGITTNLLPGEASDANLNLFWKYGGFGIGTDLGGKFTTPAQSMWDDDLYGVNCDHGGFAGKWKTGRKKTTDPTDDWKDKTLIQEVPRLDDDGKPVLDKEGEPIIDNVPYTVQEKVVTPGEEYDEVYDFGTGIGRVKNRFGGNGWNGDAYRAMSKGFYAQVTPIDGFRFAVCVPFQDFKSGWTEDAFRLGLYTEYAHELFAVGIAYDTTFDNSRHLVAVSEEDGYNYNYPNTWNLALGAKTKLASELVFNAEAFASILAAGDENAVNWGIRVPLNFEALGVNLGINPGFEMIVYNNQATEEEDRPDDDVKPATLVMAPITYKINDVASVGLDFGWTTDCMDYICAHRFVIGPNCAFNTSVGSFDLKFNAILDKSDSEEDILTYGHGDDIGFGFRLDLGYKVNLK